MKTQRSLCFENLENRRLLTAIVMTNQEQMLLELVNLARSNPTAEAAKYAIDLNDGLPTGTLDGSPKQPLAPNQLLINAAGLHSQDMLDRDYFDHVNQQGKNPGARIADTGYLASTWAENISWGGSTAAIDRDAHVFQRHERLFRSPGHRVNILSNSLVEVGMGVRYGVYTTNGNDFNASMVTEKFATRTGKLFITGVVYTDTLSADSFYTIGEGLGGLTVVAVKSSGERFETQTGTSGGYSIEVSSGTYSVTFSGGSLISPVSYNNVIINGKNTKIDLNTSQIVRLSLSFDKSSINENSGSLIATVSRSGSTTSALLINIISNQRTEADFPVSISIPAGSASTTFPVNAVNDTTNDGDKDVTIEITSNGHVSASTTFKVIDDDVLMAKPDQQLTLRNQSVDLAVVTNDLFPNSQLANLIVEITSAPNPAQGTATVVNQLISVVPAIDFDGVITLAYRVRDPLIGVSEPTQVRVGVLEFGKHNALAPLDVDANGTVTPADASLVISVLNDTNATRQVYEMPSPLAGPYVDTDGKGSVTPTDALLIINALNTRSSGEGEGESLSPAKMAELASLDIEQTWESTWQRRAGASRSPQGFRSR